MNRNIDVGNSTFLAKETQTIDSTWKPFGYFELPKNVVFVFFSFVSAWIYTHMHYVQSIRFFSHSLFLSSFDQFNTTKNYFNWVNNSTTWAVWLGAFLYMTQIECDLWLLLVSTTCSQVTEVFEYFCLCDSIQPIWWHLKCSLIIMAFVWMQNWIFQNWKST